LKHAFSPEFLNRIDEVVVFHALEKTHLITIVDILLAELNQRLLERGVELDVSDEVKAWLIQEGFQPLYGARPMRRCVQKNIGDPLSEELIKGRFRDTHKVKVVLKDGGPFFVEEEALAGV
jgi:ATP-dependent Clp protease ATP-binding subunit ClpC